MQKEKSERTKLKIKAKRQLINRMFLSVAALTMNSQCLVPMVNLLQTKMTNLIKKRKMKRTGAIIRREVKEDRSLSQESSSSSNQEVEEKIKADEYITSSVTLCKIDLNTGYHLV